jgi:hypothetical protein
MRIGMGRMPGRFGDLRQDYDDELGGEQAAGEDELSLHNVAFAGGGESREAVFGDHRGPEPRPGHGPGHGPGHRGPGGPLFAQAESEECVAASAALAALLPEGAVETPVSGGSEAGTNEAGTNEAGTSESGTEDGSTDEAGSDATDA